MLKFVRDIISPILYKLGISRKIMRIESGKYLVCYHGVSEVTNFLINNRQLNIKQFELDLAYFSKTFKIVNINDFFLLENNINKPILTITFDDGYLNNFINAIPLVRKWNIPVCFFIITKSLEDDNYITWYDLLDLIKLFAKNEIIFHDKKFEKNLKNGFYYNEIKIEEYIKCLDYERDAALELLYKSNQNSVEKLKSEFPDYWKLINNQELNKYLKEPLLTIGSHTHSHFNLANINQNLVESELKKSKSILEGICGYQINSLAYPDGSYNEKVKKIALECGYTQQLAVEYKLESDKHDKHIANRYSYSNSTTHEVNMLKMAFYAKRYNFHK